MLVLQEADPRTRQSMSDADSAMVTSHTEAFQRLAFAIFEVPILVGQASQGKFS